MDRILPSSKPIHVVERTKLWVLFKSNGVSLAHKPSECHVCRITPKSLLRGNLPLDGLFGLI